MLRAVADLKDDVVKFTQEIVRIQSYTGEEKEMAECLLHKLQEFDLDDAFIDGIGNVIGLIRGEPTGSTVMLNGHLDIVPAGNIENFWTILTSMGALAIVMLLFFRWKKWL